LGLKSQPFIFIYCNEGGAGVVDQDHLEVSGQRKEQIVKPGREGKGQQCYEEDP
jgi:hypothetical protein